MGTNSQGEKRREQLQQIASEVVAPRADEVDRQARFPIEAIAALREARLLGAAVPVELGGLGVGLTELAEMCRILGASCASSAMVFAMHQIQVACIVHHGLTSAFLTVATVLPSRSISILSRIVSFFSWIL